MTKSDARDYGDSGLVIQDAMMDHFKRFPDKRTRPKFILWNGRQIKTSDAIPISHNGFVRAEFLSVKQDLEQGFDMKLDGWFQLAKGERIPVLRTWYDERLEGVVEYPYFSKDGRLWVWNVYRVRCSSGLILERKWAENAGFWVENVSENERVYHCSQGTAKPPDFESLVFKVRVVPR